jgi:polygalacturonase
MKIRWKRITHLACIYAISVIIFVGFAAANIKAQSEKTKDLKYYLSNLPFKMPDITLPVFADNSVNIKDFGAIGNGQSLNTEAFAKAIDACAKKGGGSVIVPPGLWLTGPILFQSNINLHVEKGAIILFSPDHSLYPIMQAPGSSNFIVTPPIFGANLENIAITGEGIIDGSGETWRPVKKIKTTAAQWKELVSSGGVVSSDGNMWWPSKEAMDGEEYLKKLKSSGKKATAEDYLPARDFLRPYMVQFLRCKNMLLDGPTIQNSPKFVFYPNSCENIVMRNVKILNEWWAQNGDGIDISACKNVVIYNCFVNAGDDGICMKSSKSKNSNNEAALQNVVISDCVVYHGHGGFVIGSNTDGGMQNISVSNCNFISTDIGLRFKSSRGRGGLVENIYVKDIYMKNIANEAILFDTYYESAEGSKDVKAEVNEQTPRFQKFYLNNIYCSGAKQAISITGLPEMPIQDIEFKDITISSNTGFSSMEAQNIRLNNVSIIPQNGVVYSIANSWDFTLNKLVCPKGAETFIKLDGKSTKNIQLISTDLSPASKDVEFGTDVDKKALIKK